MNKIDRIKDIVRMKTGEKGYIEAQLEKCILKIAAIEKSIDISATAQEILQIVAKDTQNMFVSNISDVVSSALEAVFGENSYKFSVEFVQRRGKTEVDMYFIRDGEKIDPLSSSGGGAVDVASFALRVAVWSILVNSNRKISNTIILDEPFRFLSRELQPLAGNMLKMLSDKLGIQFIIVTHNQDIIENGDKVFEVSNDGSHSFVNKVKG